jgi:hypothetical protein
MSVPANHESTALPLLDRESRMIPRAIRFAACSLSFGMNGVPHTLPKLPPP